MYQYNGAQNQFQPKKKKEKNVNNFEQNKVIYALELE